jgi:hypothetical protein
MEKKRIALLLSISHLIFLAIFWATAAGADNEGLYLTEGLMGYQVNYNYTPDSVTQRTYLSSETGLGYIIGGWFYLGGIFNYTGVNEQISDNNNNTVTHNETFQYLGPSIGYMGDSLILLGNYFAYAEKKDNFSGAAAGTIDDTGSGFGVSVGYKFPLWGIEMAPVASLKFITYNNCRDPNSGAMVSCSPLVQQNEIDPYITFLFNFK